MQSKLRNRLKAQEELKLKKLFEQVVQLYRKSNDKAEINRKGLLITGKVKNLKRLEKIAIDIQKVIKCKLILLDKKNDFHVIIPYSGKKKSKKFGAHWNIKRKEEMQQVLFNRVINNFKGIIDKSKIMEKGLVISLRLHDLKLLKPLKKKLCQKTQCKIFLRELGKQKKPKNSLFSKQKEKLEHFDIYNGDEVQSNNSRRFPAFLSVLFHIALISLLTFLIVGKLHKKEKYKEIVISIVDPSESLELESPRVKSPNLSKIDPSFEATDEDLISEELARVERITDNTVFSDIVESDVITYEKSSIYTLSSSSINNSVFSGRAFSNHNGQVKKYGGTQAGQTALLKGLRWLKKTQSPNGSWTRSPEISISLTAFAVLSFTAYGADIHHKEFGETLKKALKWMLHKESLSRYKQIGYIESGYQHPIFTFALCEASALMPENTLLNEAMKRTVLTIVKGQCSDGGFPYIYGSEKSYLTLSGWNALALKSASMIVRDSPKLDSSQTKLISYFKSRYSSNSGFVYKGLPNAAHRAIGSLGLQIFGEEKCDEVVDVMKVIKRRDINHKTFSDLYAMYYLNQAIFNEGGLLWGRWVGLCENFLVMKQSKNGSWNVGYGSTMGTSMACLILTVAYRYPPTYLKVKEQKNAQEINSPTKEFMNEGMDLLE